MRPAFAPQRVAPTGGLVHDRTSRRSRNHRIIVIDLAVQSLVLLFLAAFIAGFIDSIAGGGGLITIPAMLIAGISPLETLGTNKLQSMFGAGSATIAYARRGHVDLNSQLPMAAMAVFGGALGAAIATVVPGEVLRAIMPFLLVAIALYFALKPNLHDEDRNQRMTPFVFGLTFVPLIGFYDGVFGPGTGSFFMLAFVSLAGFGVLKATAHTKLLNLGSNVGAFLVFLAGGVVLWKVGLLMGLGQFLGAQAGSRLAMRIGARLIKPLLIVTCIGLASKLLMDPTNPVRLWMGF
ncbi:TSUP family transporter [Rhizobium daejeonense]|uniref:Probable membrane transporter protein n=1 Tax=Rhizobium daejeonense TaxID=240521 RepID=A0A6M1S1F5_9HYPH|nr:TSUP family transporter [Rhizobium daejeonense]NGO63067.1 TSUP family transporter [Rhizobium daejeonense]